MLSAAFPAIAAVLVLLASSTSAAGPDDHATFSRGIIAPIVVASDGHVSAFKNGVHFDVYFDAGRKTTAVIYVINTGRKQLVLTPAHHRRIVEGLIRRKFTVIIADFRDKPLAGLDLERYVVQLTTDAREAADGVLPATRMLRPPLASRDTAASSKTDTFAADYFTLMPGFTIERDVAWFRYGDIPAAFRQAIAMQLGSPYSEEDATVTNTYDIIYPAYGPDVGVLTNYASDEKGRQDFYPLDTMYLVQAFALKNLAIVHQQYFNDPAGGYPKGYGYYGDQFAACFIRHLKGNAARYHINPRKICCFGHSKGSELPGMLVNRLRGRPPYLYGKVDFKKLGLDEQGKRIPSVFSDLPTDISCAILGAGVANNELGNESMLPWGNEPTRHISPFFIFADHRELTRERTRAVVAKARAHGVIVDSAELDGHTWPHGEAYDRASAFVDRFLELDD